MSSAWWCAFLIVVATAEGAVTLGQNKPLVARFVKGKPRLTDRLPIPAHEEYRTYVAERGWAPSMPWEERSFDGKNNPTNLYKNNPPNPYENNLPNPYDNNLPNPYDNNLPNPYDNHLNPYENNPPNPYDNNLLNPYENNPPNPYENNLPNPYENNLPNPYENNPPNPYDNNPTNLYDNNPPNPYKNLCSKKTNLLQRLWEILSPEVMITPSGKGFEAGVDIAQDCSPGPMNDLVVPPMERFSERYGLKRTKRSPFDSIIFPLLSSVLHSLSGQSHYRRPPVNPPPFNPPDPIFPHRRHDPDCDPPSYPQALQSPCEEPFPNPPDYMMPMQHPMPPQEPLPKAVENFMGKLKQHLAKDDEVAEGGKEDEKKEEDGEAAGDGND